MIYVTREIIYLFYAKRHFKDRGLQTCIVVASETKLVKAVGDNETFCALTNIRSCCSCIATIGYSKTVGHPIH